MVIFRRYGFPHYVANEDLGAGGMALVDFAAQPWYEEARCLLGNLDSVTRVDGNLCFEYGNVRDLERVCVDTGDRIANSPSGDEVRVRAYEVRSQSQPRVKDQQELLYSRALGLGESHESS
jgi:hypothetical protein